MKSSSETRFAKVSRRSELYSSGKRSFEVLKKIRRGKMKYRESSETRFGKVWRRSEPCSRDKQSFEKMFAKVPKVSVVPRHDQM